MKAILDLNIPDLIESFFMERLMSQRSASPNTILSYRDTFRLLFSFLQIKLKKAPSQLQLEDLSAESIVSFLGDLEKKRDCSARSRNQRLAAIRSFFHYLSYKVPQRSALIQQVLSIPKKQHDKALIDFLNQNEIDALLQCPDQGTWIGRRDYLLLATAIHTGFRLSELTQMTWSNVHLGHGAYVRVTGKGRKERAIPLSAQLATALRSWREIRGKSDSAVFTTQAGERLSSDAVQRLLAKYLECARKRCPSLKHKRVSPHVLRHSTAMRLLQSGVGQPIIALWLGHESVETTQIYLNADLKMKEKVLEKTAPFRKGYQRYQPKDRLLTFLQEL